MTAWSRRVDDLVVRAPRAAPHSGIHSLNSVNILRFPISTTEEPEETQMRVFSTQQAVRGDFVRPILRAG
jgi:hypothetical protein